MISHIFTTCGKRLLPVDVVHSVIYVEYNFLLHCLFPDVQIKGEFLKDVQFITFGDDT